MEENDELNATEEAQVMSYVMLSRAKFLEKVWVMSPFPQQLFAQGPPKGPHVLMRKLRGEITVDEAKKEFADAPDTKKKDPKKQDVMTTLHRCAQCFLSLENKTS